MTDLPEDIIHKVVENIYYRDADNHNPPTYDGGVDYKTLSSCALVSSVWRNPSQSLLFKSIFLNRSFRETFLAVDIDERKLSLLQSVRMVHRATVAPRPRAAVASTTVEELGFALITLLERCPMLYELTLIVQVSGTLSDALFSQLRQFAQRSTLNFRSLKVVNCNLQSRLICQLLSSFPTLQFVWIQCEIGLPPIPGSTCTAQLYELRLNRNISDDYLRWILGASQGSLQILELRDIPGRGMLDILKPYCSTVRSLRLMPFNMISAELATMCTNLEELVLAGVPNVFPLPPVLPSSLTRLVVVLLNVTERTRLAQYTRVVNSHAPLKSFTIRGPARSVEDFQAFADACRANDVSLELDGWEIGFWLDEPCIHARKFPRRRSVSNFRLMTD